jgi:hypothetical protein
MSNERLGIYEELQERRERYANQGEATRRKIMGVGPQTPDGGYAQLSNPFAVRALSLRMQKPRLRRHDLPPAGSRRRAIWPEAELGLNVLQVVQAVVLESGLSAGELLDPSHKKRVSWPRQVAMWAIDRYCPEYSLPEIAYIFRRDHTTVMHGIEATNVRLVRHCPETEELVGKVRARLRAAAGG